MAGVFSRRLLPPSRQAGVQSRGLPGRGMTSEHAGSKPGYIQLSDMGPARCFERAQAWSQATGRPLPPQMRPRSPLTPTAPHTLRQRAAAYLALGQPVAALVLSPLPAADLLDSPLLTPAQRRRLLHKAGAHGERPRKYTPAVRAAPGPAKPRTPAARARARKNAAQQARHWDRLVPSETPWASPDADVAGDLRKAWRDESQ